MRRQLDREGALDGRRLGGREYRKEKGAPTAVVLHIPCWFLKDVSAAVDGKAVAIVGDAVTLAPDVAKVELHCTRGEEPRLSHEEAVRLFLEKFHRKPVDATERFLFRVTGTGGK